MKQKRLDKAPGEGMEGVGGVRRKRGRPPVSGETVGAGGGGEDGGGEALCHKAHTQILASPKILSPAKDSPENPQDLLALAAADPTQFDQAAGDYCQAMILEGLRDIPPPRTITEAVKWEGLRRQFKGVDAKTAPRGLFDPVRPLRRATGITVEAETARPSGDDLLAGFEV